MNTPSVIIHIGYHKTASTYLQKQIFPLLEMDYVFLRGASLQSLLYADAYDPVSVQRSISQQTVASGQRPLLISQEALSGHPHGYDTFDPFVVAERLQATYPEAKIICIIREQFDYILSLYAYRVCVKGFESRRITQFIREEIAKGLQDKLCYDRLIRRYRQLFAPERLLVLPYEMLKQNQDAFFQIISGFLGQPLPVVTLSGQSVNYSTRLLPVININRQLNKPFHLVRISLEKMAVPRLTNGFRWRYYGFKRHYLLPLLNKMYKNGQRLTFPADLKRELSPLFRDSNAHFVAMTNIDLQTYGYV